MQVIADTGKIVSVKPLAIEFNGSTLSESKLCLSSYFNLIEKKVDDKVCIVTNIDNTMFYVIDKLK